MKNVNYINNIGLNTLISIKEMLNEYRHDIYMCNLQHYVKDFMETLGYVRYFNVEANVDIILQMIE